MREQYLNRRNIVYNILKDINGLKTNLPKGAFYFFPDITYFLGLKTEKGDEIKSANDLSLYLLEYGKISLVPGEDFGAPNCIRLSYAASEKDLIEAIKRLSSSLNKLT